MFVEGRCAGCSILLYNHIFSYRYQIYLVENGTNGLDGEDGANGQKGFDGGVGGNGGDGGVGGTVKFVVPGLAVVLDKVGGKGGDGGKGGQKGLGGIGGVGGDGGLGDFGFRQTKVWTANKKYSDNFICDGCKNTLEENNLSYDNFLETILEPEPCCQGASGLPGTRGMDGEDGLNGPQGGKGQKASNSRHNILQSF